MTFVSNKNRILSVPLLLLMLLGLIAVFAPVPDAPSFRDVVIVFIPLLFYAISHQYHINKVSVAYFSIWLVAMLSTSMSNYVTFESTVITYFSFILMVVLFSSTSFIPKQLNLFVNFYIALAIVCVFLITLSFIAGVEHGYNRYSIDIIGYDRNPNYINSVIILAIVFVLYRLFRKKNFRLGYFFILIFLCYGSFMTGTRAAILTIAVCFAFTFAFEMIRKRSIFNLFVVGTLVSIISFVLIIYVPDVVSQRFSSENAFEDEVRMYMWERNYSQFQLNPMIGMGLNATTKYTSSLGLKIDNMHNVLLQFIYEHGIVGLMLFMFILINIFLRTKKYDRGFMVTMSIAMYIPIMFQNGLVALTFWWPLIVLEVFSNTSQRYSLKEL